MKEHSNFTNNMAAGQSVNQPNNTKWLHDTKKKIDDFVLSMYANQLKANMHEKKTWFKKRME